jgi:cyanophycinase-like exopeptidase
MGRSLGFLARIVQEGWSAHPREIAIDENSALLVEPDGRAQVVGTGRGAYFLALGLPPEMCKPETALSIRDIQSYHARGGTSFDLKLWVGTEGEPYSVSAIRGKMRSSIRRVY